MTISKGAAARFSKEMGPLTFALFMRVSRGYLGLTQAEFGKKLGISRTNVCDIEKGRQLVSATFAIRVAKKAHLSETQALRACLQDQARKVGYVISLKVS